MDLFDLLSLIGGLCLFLYGMNVMGEALERRAGNSLQSLLGKLTTGKLIGLFTGLAVTAVIQSSSATTVMVVGFVNSGLMTLSQAINVIMGANVGTTVTAWILSLSGIEGDNLFVQLLKPTSFTPILALIGIIMQMVTKDSKHKDTGAILLGFAVLMFGMDTMSGAVKGLRDETWFTQLFIMFDNPILGVLAGAVLTAIIQSSSASVGILQALAITGQISLGAAIPIIMGQNIGTCITALLSSMGTNKNARRAALVHLSFNVIGTGVWLIVFIIVKNLFAPAMLALPVDAAMIAVAHSVFNIACTALLLPMGGLLEKLACRLIPETKDPDAIEELDERLLATPSLALERSRMLTVDMGRCAAEALTLSLKCLDAYDADSVKRVIKLEDKTDHYEDMVGSYLVKLSSGHVSDDVSENSAMLLKVIGDFERIGDHAANLVKSAEEMKDKKIRFSAGAAEEMRNVINAVSEIMTITVDAFERMDYDAAAHVEPLEQIIDKLKELLRRSHITRLQQGECSIEAGFVLHDVLTNLERVSDHCSNVAGGVIDMGNHNLNTHESLRHMKTDSIGFKELYAQYAAKYLPASK